MIIFKKNSLISGTILVDSSKQKPKRKLKMTIMWQFESQFDLVGTTQVQLFIIKQDEPLDDAR